MSQNSIHDDKNIYRRQMIQMSEDAKKTITLKSEIIIDCVNDCELGKLVRLLLNEKINACDEHIKHVKSL
jgi:hypothetical protein